MSDAEKTTNGGPRWSWVVSVSSALLTFIASMLLVGGWKELDRLRDQDVRLWEELRAQAEQITKARERVAFLEGIEHARKGEP